MSLYAIKRPDGTIIQVTGRNSITAWAVAFEVEHVLDGGKKHLDTSWRRHSFRAAGDCYPGAPVVREIGEMLGYTLVYADVVERKEEK